MRHRLLAGMTCALLSLGASAQLAATKPGQACNYLTGAGLPTTTYRQQADGIYRCASPHIAIGTVPGRSGRLNDIAYAAEGGAQSIAALRLSIDVDNPEQAAAIHRRLKDVANMLARKLRVDLPASIQDAIASGADARVVIDNWTVSVRRADRATGGYAVAVVFE